jgi:type II secretory ATPase GspE/PulE/Tfp pilus assembly ATPase PilB-like protein/ActR/RegA family two-component response regulator
MHRPKHWLIGVAQRAGLIDADAVDAEPACPVGEVWTRLGKECELEDGAIAAHVAAHFHLNVADMDSPEPGALKLIPEKVARQLRVFPLRQDDRNLVVATCNPTDLNAEEMVGFASGRRPVFEIAAPAQLDQAIETAYRPNSDVEKLLHVVPRDGGGSVAVLEAGGPEAVAAEETESGPVVKLTNVILHDAVARGASDIHIEPGRTGGNVRFRVDGVLRHYMQMPMSALSRVVSRIKIVGGLDIADRLRPQGGRARIRVENSSYDLRVSTVPTREAEKAVIRILNPEGSRSLDDLGVPDRELRHIRHMLQHREGIVVITGPTGSGKTTTLYAALRELDTGEVNIMTVEDPVEYELPGITQIQVEPRQGVTFASALRAIVRQDPDVILIGEVRDLETAEIAVQASLSGHLVLATLHTNDALGVVARLRDLGLDRTSVAESLCGLVAQHLMRRVCSDCAVTIDSGELTGEERRLAQVYGVQPNVRSVGCDSCGGTGYRGRVAVIEAASIAPELREMIAVGSTTPELRQVAYGGGMRPLRDAALDRVRDGTTTLDEVERALGEKADKAIAPPDDDRTHVLIVDDDLVIRRLARTLLEKSGIKVSEAVDGAAALEHLRSGRLYDLMVLDLNMPEVNGDEVLRRVRGSAATAGLPVVILTGSDGGEMEVKLMEEGADDYIRKPIDPPRFVARIKAALRRAGG